MTKTKLQLEQEIVALKQELDAVRSHVKMWQDAHAAALKALAAEIRHPEPAAPMQIAPYVYQYTSPYEPPTLPLYTITCTTTPDASLVSSMIKVSS